MTTHTSMKKWVLLVVTNLTPEGNVPLADAIGYVFFIPATWCWKEGKNDSEFKFVWKTRARYSRGVSGPDMYYHWQCQNSPSASAWGPAQAARTRNFKCQGRDGALLKAGEGPGTGLTANKMGPRRRLTDTAHGLL